MSTEQLNSDRQELINYIDSAYSGESAIQTPLEALRFYVHEQPTEMLSTLYEPSLCIVVQGEKEVGFDHQLVRYNPKQYLLASIHTPAQVRVTSASTEKPYKGFTLSFSMEQIFEVLKEIESEDVQIDGTQKGLYFGDLTPKLLDAVTRLVRTLDSPEERKVLAPLFIKEILFFVMRDKGGSFIRQYIKDDHSTKRAVQAIFWIKEHFSESLNIKDLAEKVGMSESSLYSAFKRITTLSPLQFQKTLRLDEARKLLTIQKLPVNEVAFRVGYESPSQFSREYSRMHGSSPRVDAKRVVGEQ